MTGILIKLGISLVAAIVVMIVHELTKSLVYLLYMRCENETCSKKEIFKVWEYIDPIGLILGVTQFGIFSRQYPFLIKSKKAAVCIGAMGYISMILLTIVSSFCYWGTTLIDLTQVTKNMFYVIYFFSTLAMYIAFHSITMLLINLFPLTSFDISLIIAGKAPGVFMKIRKYDAVLKLILMLLLIIQIFSSIGAIITGKILL